ncbi:hypothetical protein [Actinomadura violacea]|uniref:Uncharacterized protein n=1 Tax=Actinomadura violacea TaxID=2819934 RepID=A0ABS3RXU6_9ACTN|nr:hypothetical protein [Actinomadura violacea]MBO2461577.1 hypothetical protein [Actinomadura violacea]
MEARPTPAPPVRVPGPDYDTMRRLNRDFDAAALRLLDECRNERRGR